MNFKVIDCTCPVSGRRSLSEAGFPASGPSSSHEPRSHGGGRRFRPGSGRDGALAAGVPRAVGAAQTPAKPPAEHAESRGGGWDGRHGNRLQSGRRPTRSLAAQTPRLGTLRGGPRAWGSSSDLTGEQSPQRSPAVPAHGAPCSRSSRRFKEFSLSSVSQERRERWIIYCFLAKPHFLVTSNHPECIYEPGDNLQMWIQLCFETLVQISRQKRGQNPATKAHVSPAVWADDSPAEMCSPHVRPGSRAGRGVAAPLGPGRSHGPAWEVTDLYPFLCLVFWAWFWQFQNPKRSSGSRQ